MNHDNHSTPRGNRARYYPLVALRSTLALAVVFGHAIFAYVPAHPDWDWPVVDPSTSQLLAAVSSHLLLVLNPGFFLVSGYLARSRWSGSALFARRLLRLTLVLVGAWYLLFAVTSLIVLWHAVRTGHPDLPPGAAELPLWKLGIGLITTESYRRHFSLMHLWYLYDLLLLSSIGLVLVLGARQSKPVAQILRVVGRGLVALLDARWAVVGLALLSWPLFAAMPVRLPVIDLPHAELIPPWHIFTLFAFSFVVGWLLASRSDMPLGRCWWLWLLVGGLAYVPVGWLVLRDYHGPAVASLVRLAVEGCKALSMWALIAGLIGLFWKHASRPNRFIDFLRRGTLWIYLAHFPLVLLLQTLLYPWHAPWQLKFTVVMSATLTLLLVPLFIWTRVLPHPRDSRARSPSAT